MARVELPESRLKARRRRRLRRLGVVFCLLLVALAAGAVAASHIPALRIISVQVSGTQTLSSSTVEGQVRESLAGEYLWVLPRNSVFVYPKAAIEQELLATYPGLSSVQVHAVDFHTVAVALVERSPRALWCAAESDCFFMDENGVVYGPAPSFSAPVYTLYYGSTTPSTSSEQTGEAFPKQFLRAEDFQALSALVDAVVEKISTATSTEQLAGVSVDENADVAMRFASGFELRFSLRDAAGDLFERFSLALQSDVFKNRALSTLQYLDLRFGDKLYYKLK